MLTVFHAVLHLLSQFSPVTQRICLNAEKHLIAAALYTQLHQTPDCHLLAKRMCMLRAHHTQSANCFSCCKAGKYYSHIVPLVLLVWWYTRFNSTRLPIAREYIGGSYVMTVYETDTIILQCW